MHERVTFQEQFVDCGYKVVQTFSISNLLLDSNPSSDDQFFRFSYTWQSTAVYTNPLTGEQAYASGHGAYKEIQPRSLGDGLFTYVQHNPGTFVLRDSAGNLLLRETGRVTFLWLFDSLSHTAPGGAQISATLQSVSGPHPTLVGWPTTAMS